MKPKSEKPLVLGITPVGLGYLGLAVMLIVATCTTKLIGIVAWVMRWLGL